LSNIASNSMRVWTSDWLASASSGISVESRAALWPPTRAGSFDVAEFILIQTVRAVRSCSRPGSLANFGMKLICRPHFAAVEVPFMARSEDLSERAQGGYARSAKEMPGTSRRREWILTSQKNRRRRQSSFHPPSSSPARIATIASGNWNFSRGSMNNSMNERV
jgi:hypothetical protein